MTQTVLVTGGAGFLGSNLCDRLLAEGNKVICLDDLSTGSLDNIAHLASEPRFDFMEANIIEPLTVQADAIFNLACPASPPKYQSDPVRTIKTSVIGTLNLLELAHKTGASIFHTSTSEVYGDAEIHPQPESYHGNVNPIGIRACYDEGKRCAETLIFDFNRMHNLPVKVVRIFNTYGPRMAPDDGRVVTNFIKQALRGDDMTVNGDGTQTRSFCYVDDMIDIFILVWKADPSFLGPVNVGNPGEFQMRELAELVLELTGSPSRLVYEPLPADDPKQRRPDISLANKMFGWSPQISLRDGLQRTIEAMRTRQY